MKEPKAALTTATVALHPSAALTYPSAVQDTPASFSSVRPYSLRILLMPLRTWHCGDLSTTSDTCWPSTVFSTQPNSDAAPVHTLIKSPSIFASPAQRVVAAAKYAMFSNVTQVRLP